MARFRVNKRRDVGRFKSRASKSHKRNFQTVMRGGIRW